MLNKETVIINQSNLRRISYATISALGNVESATRQIGYAIKSLDKASEFDCMGITLEELNYAIQDLEFVPLEQILTDLRAVKRALENELQGKKQEKVA